MGKFGMMFLGATFSEGEKLSMVGVDCKSFEDMDSDWYKEVIENADDTNANEKVSYINQEMYPVELLVYSLISYTNNATLENMKTQGVTIRPTGLAEIWGYIKSFAGKIDPEIMKKSTIVQVFIEEGYKPEYKDVPETEFNDFAAKYKDPEFAAKKAAAAAAEAAAAAAVAAAEAAKKKSLFGKFSSIFDGNKKGGGRKSRKQNKSRKQGKSKKQRKSRK
jgi:hypothetical protein